MKSQKLTSFQEKQVEWVERFVGQRVDYDNAKNCVPLGGRDDPKVHSIHLESGGGNYSSGQRYRYVLTLKFCSFKDNMNKFGYVRVLSESFEPLVQRKRKFTNDFSEF